MSEPSDIPDERADDLTLAGEYALGLVSESERRLLDTRVANDPAFARLVEDWSGRLQPLADELTPLSPPQHVWDAIAAKIEGAPSPAPKRLWDSLFFWRSMAGLAGAAALCALVMLGIEQAGRTDQPLVVALQSANAGMILLARVEPGTSRLVVGGASFPLESDRVPELWVIPGDGRPRSLGVIDRTQSSSITIPRALTIFLQAGSTLAVSDEPVGGSPTGLPTGPVIATGKLQKI